MVNMSVNENKRRMLLDAADWHSRIAEQFDARYQYSPAFRERLQIWTDLIKRHAKPDGDALDAGCGSGVLSVVAAEHSRRVIAFDASAEMVRLAREKQTAASELSNVEFRELRMEQIADLGEEDFAIVLSSSVLEYLDDFSGALDALAARLIPGGTLIFTMPNMSSLYRKAERVAFRITRRPRYMAFVRSQPSDADIRRHLAARGFDVIETVVFSPAALLSWAARPLGLARFADNLIAYVCRKGSACKGI